MKEASIMDLHDEIYYSLIGQLGEGEAFPWVDNAFGSGSPCDAAYTRLVEARNRVLAKLGRDADPDLEQVMEEMNTIQRILCRRVMELRSL